MSKFTLLNLQDLENMSVKYGHGQDMEARFATKPLELKEMGLGYQKVLPNRTIPFKHKHEQQEEIYIVLSGEGQMHLDDEALEVKPLDAVRVAAEVVRTVSAGPDGLEIIIVGAPLGDTNDTVMIRD